MERRETAENHSCGICMQLLYLPQKFQGCSHYFCKECVDRLFEEGPEARCPMCRKAIKKTTTKEDNNMAEAIQRRNPEEYEKRRKAYEQFSSLRPMAFIIHNTATTTDGEWYDWNLFVKAEDGRDARYIEYVQLTLHPTFTPRTVRISRAPFMLERKGWGTFNIGVAIQWKDIFNKERQQFNYQLTFHPTAANQRRIVKRFNS